MNHEDYCSYELSKKMKEKGFRWHCNHYYRANGDFYECHPAQCFNDSEYERYDAPLMSIAQKWLRDEKGIAINVTAHDGGFYQWEEIYLPNAPEYECFIEPDIVQYSTYEQALSAGLLKTIESI